MSKKESAQTINKLFLIGNGLDLALGLKTSYTDFMFWLLKKQLLEAAENFGRQEAPKPYRGRFIEVFGEYEPLTIFGYSSNELFDILFKENYGEIPNKIESADNLQDLLSVVKTYKISIQPKFANSLFTSIYSQCNAGWVNIEETYFVLLKSILNDKRNVSITDLNSELETITDYLQQYLLELEIDLPSNIVDQFFKQFASQIIPDEIINNKKDYSKIVNGHLYFLNFNYTEALSIILSKSGKEFNDYTINNIHGSFEFDEPIIFGYGDEMDEDYKKIENLRDNDFLKHIKSFRYFQNKNYRDLLRFLNSNSFQVCVYGHSCDISDRIMLNEIFEHENCVSVKVYFYRDKDGNPDFTNKTMNISRHFNSNKLMRQKIVEFNPDNEIPQIK